MSRRMRYRSNMRLRSFIAMSVGRAKRFVGELRRIAARTPPSTPPALEPVPSQVVVGGQSFVCFTNQAETDAYTEWIRNGAGTEAPVHWAHQLAEQSWRVLDLGANVGTFAFSLAGRCREVVAVEALTTNYVLLTLGVAANPDRRVIPVHAAAWSSNQAVSIEGHSAWAQTDGRRGGDVPALTLPLILRTFCHDDVDLIKVDIEGAEEEIFPALLDYAASRSRLAVIYESNQAVTTRDVRHMHHEAIAAGFRLWYLDAKSLRPLPVLPDDPQPFLNCDVLGLKGHSTLSGVGEQWTSAELAERMAWEIQHNGTELCRTYARAVVEHMHEVGQHPSVRVALSSSPLSSQDESDYQRFSKLWV